MFGKIILLLALVLGIGFISFASLVPAAAEFKDPYNGGIKLPQGGGEPGKAYLAFIDAAYKNDHAKICKLMSDDADVAQCLQQKEMLNAYIAMFTQPKSQVVLGGSMKAGEATLNVAYTFASGSQSTGFVVMRQMKGKWVLSSTGGSGSATIEAEASGKADLGSSSSPEGSGRAKVRNK